jgi:DNA-binding IclR family transcriptional regulator
MDTPLGIDRPFNCTAVGKVLLAGLPNSEIERLASENAFEQRTEQSICEVEALRTEVEQVREQGWARDNEEYNPGVGCIAAPVRDHEGQIIAALTVSGPAERIEQKLDRIVARVTAHASAISEEMGFRSPQPAMNGRVQ